jgi:iron(III) transport system substrate-binding protein
VKAAAAQSVEDILLYKGPDREQKLIEGAKKEGQVVIYSALIVNQAMRPIADRFGKKYHWRPVNSRIVPVG